MRQLDQLALVVRCFAYALVRGRARRVPTPASCIAVVQLAKLGDMVCTTPMFEAIKRSYPHARVIVVGNAINKKLLDGHPQVDEYVVWEGGVSSMAARLRALHLDAACITAPSAEALAALYLAGTPAIVCPRIENGWSPYETRAYKLLRSLALVLPHRMHHYAAREYLTLLEPLGIRSNDTNKTLVVSGDAHSTAKQFVESLPPHQLLVGIAPSAGNKIKEWPPERFAQVADYLVQTYDADVIVFGAGPDAPQVEAMMRAVKQTSRVVNTLNTLSIEELKAYVQSLDLFVSADTGPIYVAEAFGVPTIDIVGPVDEREQPPIGPNHRVVVPQRSKPELFVMNARVYNTQEVMRQAQATSAETVEREIDSLLLSLKHHEAIS